MYSTAPVEKRQDKDSDEANTELLMLMTVIVGYVRDDREKESKRLVGHCLSPPRQRSC